MSAAQAEPLIYTAWSRELARGFTPTSLDRRSVANGGRGRPSR